MNPQMLKLWGQSECKQISFYNPSNLIFITVKDQSVGVLTVYCTHYIDLFSLGFLRHGQQIIRMEWKTVSEYIRFVFSMSNWHKQVSE